MEIFVTVGLFLVGALLIIKGGDVFIDAAGWVSDVSGISKAVIGATIVSFATTAPEYFVSLLATLKGYTDLSVGNAVGSLICNIGIAFALLAMCTPGKVHDKLFGVKGLTMLGATVLLLISCLNGAVSVVEGLLLIAVFAFFTIVNIRFSKDGEEKAERRPTNRREIVINIVKFVGGAAAIIIGSDFIVDSGRDIAARIGISETVIGLTVIAIGTALPEIVTSVAAIIKKQNALSLGNIIGANILDATLILATGAFVSGGGLTVPASTTTIDLPFLIMIMAIAVLPTFFKKKVYRAQGALIASCYVLYLIYIIAASLS